MWNEVLSLMNFLLLKKPTGLFYYMFVTSYSVQCILSEVMIPKLELDHNAVQCRDGVF